ncbi:MAG: DUF5916 domain-containing protein [Gemmatimonadota bacterium]
MSSCGCRARSPWRRAAAQAVFVVTLMFAWSGATEAQMARTDAQSAVAGASAAVRAAPLVGGVRIDGVLDEPAWRSAEAVTAFTQRMPDEGEPASERTEVRVLVGPDALYIGARLFDSEPDLIRAALVRRDVVSDFDYVIVNIDSRHDHNTAFAFTLTPSGSYQDAALGVDGEYDFGWDPVWDGAATIDEQGWSAEWRIPFSQLRFESAEDAEWGIQFTRVIARKQEVATFPFVPRNETSGPHRYGHLTGLGQVREPGRLELFPYATARSEHLMVSADDPFRTGADRFYKAGLDLKYGITGNLTLDATINPDFGQVEVDPAVVNLTQYETFYPERRPFFVEGAEIFRYGFPGFEMAGTDLGSLFYSRRIGRPPQGGFGGLGAAWTDVPDQSTIAGAAKVSGRIGSWSVGVLEAATLEETGRYQRLDGSSASVPVEPFTNYVVGRARRDFNEGNSTVGGIVTAVNRDLSDPALAGLLHSGAFVGGLDFIRYWDDREWFVTGTLTGSRVRGSADAILRTQRSSARYWQRPDARRVALDSTRTSLDGWRGSLAAGRKAGDHWRGAIAVQAKSPGFEANDLGFESRVDNWGVNAAFQYRDIVPGRLTRSFQVDLVPDLQWNFDGDLLGASVFLGSVQQWSNYWRSSTALTLYPERDSDTMTRGGPVGRAPAGGSIGQWIASDQRKPWSAQLSLNYAWNARGGWGFSRTFNVTVRPSSALELTLGPEYNRTHAVAQYVAAVRDPSATRTLGSRYVFSDLDRTTISMTTRLSWTFTPRLSFQLYAQPFLAAGDYSRFKELHEPRKWDWDVYGEDAGIIDPVGGGYRIDPDAVGPASAFTLAEPDFNVRSLRGNAVLRWEYRPGSTMYFVWQQRRSGFVSVGDSRFSHDADALIHLRPENVFAIKLSYWWGH